MSEIEEFITTEQAARIMKVSVETVRRWANSGLVKSRRIGGVLRIRRSSLVGPTPERGESGDDR